jgi:formate--tetrahydrofolate ligase
MTPIADLAREQLGIEAQHLEPYGHYKAKISLDYINSLQERPDGKLILMTAISPTPAGEGKTTTVVGLGDALSRLGKKAMICLREPALGPCFGIKGGAAGGGLAQVVPMEEINLHFTGDMAAIGSAHNLLSSLIDNHIHFDNPYRIDLRRVQWRRVMDVSDRVLRHVVVGLGGTANALPREDGFDIVVASEVMAILCLSSSLQELREKLGNITIGYRRLEDTPIFARDLKAAGAMTVLLRDAIKPNLVQSLESTPALVHGGPFGNIAHGCNSAMATRTALKLADYVVTEAGFGADLGAEKFMNIKCRKTGLRPSIAVLVATVRALKYQGGVKKEHLNTENLESLKAGMPNLKRHLHNMTHNFGLPCVVAINHFTADTDAEIRLLQEEVEKMGAQAVVSRHWAEGGKGAEELAHAVLKTLEEDETKPPQVELLYDDNASLWDKLTAVATRIYGASEVLADTKVREQIARASQDYPHFPVCVAKTQYSFSSDPDLLGAPSGHVLPVREVRLATGAEFLIAICGNMMTMPGLPRHPAAENIDINETGETVGLF